MNSTRIYKAIRGLAVATAMVFGVIVFAGTDANAQYGRYDDRYGRYDDRYDDDRYNGRDRNGNQSPRFAYNKGYHDGVKQGMRDARNGRGNYGYNNPYYDNNRRYSNNGSVLGRIFGRPNGNYNSTYSTNQQAYKEGFDRGYYEGLNRVRNKNGKHKKDRYYNGY